MQIPDGFKVIDKPIQTNQRNFWKPREGKEMITGIVVDFTDDFNGDKIPLLVVIDKATDKEYEVGLPSHKELMAYLENVAIGDELIIHCTEIGGKTKGNGRKTSFHYEVAIKPGTSPGATSVQDDLPF